MMENWSFLNMKLNKNEQPHNRALEYYHREVIIKLKNIRTWSSDIYLCLPSSIASLSLASSALLCSK